MRVLQLTDYAGPSSLRVADLPKPRSEIDAVIDVHAVGINFPDLLATQGLYQLKPPLPFVPGCEVAGVVRSAPDGSGWSPGERAAAFVWQGGYAEQVAVPVHHLMRIPEGVDFPTAAAMVVNYHTVFFALKRRGSTRKGETVLVLGAAGGIGTAAVQVAKGLGARVLGGVATPEQADVALAAGADETLLLEEGFAAEVRRRTGDRGVDVVLDPLGDWIFDEALRALASEGRILIVGFAAGAIPRLKVNRLLLRNVSAVGVAWGAYLDGDRELMANASVALATMVDEGSVRPHIGARFAFDEIPEALHALSRGEIPGKAIAVIRDT